MQIIEPVVISVAGFDPSAGAGILADIKTLEQHGVYGISACTAITVQTEKEFSGVRWMPPNFIVEQIEMLMNIYKPAVAKIGLVENNITLQEIVITLKKLNPDIKIVWDPILKSSSGFIFHDDYKFDTADIFLITPNLDEAKKLFGEKYFSNPAFMATQVLVKGGHNNLETCDDILYEFGVKHIIEGKRMEGNKHGTGCVLSAAIAAQLACGKEIAHACALAKEYINQFIQSHQSLSGWHHIIQTELQHD